MCGKQHDAGLFTQAALVILVLEMAGKQRDGGLCNAFRLKTITPKFIIIINSLW